MTDLEQKCQFEILKSELGVFYCCFKIVKCVKFNFVKSNNYAKYLK